MHEDKGINQSNPTPTALSGRSSVALSGDSSCAQEAREHAHACQASDETLRLYLQQLGVLGKRKQLRCVSQELARLSVK